MQASGQTCNMHLEENFDRGAGLDVRAILRFAVTVAALGGIVCALLLLGSSSAQLLLPQDGQPIQPLYRTDSVYSTPCISVRFQSSASMTGGAAHIDEVLDDLLNL